MAAFYEYLMASLPSLQFGARPPFGPERLIALCRDKIPAEDLAVIERIAGPLDYEAAAGQKTLDDYLGFETALRNELALIRASRRKTDATKFLRRQGQGDALLYHAALHAHRIPSPQESEKFLDAERWKKLDELGLGHYFDLQALVVYALKLSILARWEAIRTIDKEKALEKASAVPA